MLDICFGTVYSETFEKNITYNDIKSDSKTKLCILFRNIFLGLMCGFF